jgi:hypothetical protein
MRTKTYALTGQTIAAANVAAAQAPTAGTPLTLTSSPFVFGVQKTFTGYPSASPGGIPAGTPSEITITTLSGAPAGEVFTVIGYDRWGTNIITETITNTAGGAATLAGKCVYSEILSVTPSISDTNNVSVGVPQRVTTPWIPVNNFKSHDQAALAYFAADNLVGTPTFTLESTSLDANAFGVGQTQNIAAQMPGQQPNSLSGISTPYFYGDNFPIDTTSTTTFGAAANTQIPGGAQWARLVITSAAGSSAIARCVRPSY